MIRHDQRPWLRFLVLLCAAAVLALYPLSATAKVTAVLHGGDLGEREGDPIDSNDFGGGGNGGSHDDVNDSYAVAHVGSDAMPGIVVGKWTLVVVPSQVLGVTVFSFVVIDRDAFVGEAGNAQ